MELSGRALHGADRLRIERRQYLYDNTELAAVHAIADKKWNYQEEHYTALTVYALKDDSE